MKEKLQALGVTFTANEPMKFHTSFHIGGPCDYLVCPDSVDQLQEVVRLAREEGVRLTVVGNGSNLLVSDDGIDGIVLKTTALNQIKLEENRIHADCGATLSAVSHTAVSHGLDGMCELSGIPGSVGGAVYMNAGAYGGEVKDVLKETLYLDEHLNLNTLTNSEHQFSYRHSIFSDRPDWVVLRSVFELNTGDTGLLKEKNLELLRKRNEKQPLNYPNAGSIFKRPEGYFAGKLIEDCQLRGYLVGGAQVSEKHCGFIVNRGDATASDVCHLIAHIRQVVLETFGVMLEPEVRYLKRGNPDARL